jgi:hypothetical protein
MKVHFSDLQRTSSFPYGIAVRKGIYENLSAINKFGFKASVGATFETIWDGSGNYTYPSAADYVDVVCTDGVNDVSGGTGANSVTIEGLDASYNIQRETITLDNPDSAGVEGRSANQYIRLFRAFVATAGSQGTNDDVIDFNIGAVNAAKITAGAGQTLMAVYTIPAGKRAYLVNFNFGEEKAKETLGRIMVRPLGGAFNVKDQLGTSGPPVIRDYSLPIIIDAKSDIEVRALAGATTGVNAGFDLLLEDI